MPIILELALKTLSRNKRFAVVFTLTFSLGIGGIFVLDYFKSAMAASLASEAKSFLGADLELGSRFAIGDAEKALAREHLPPIEAEIDGLALSSMATSPKRSRLVQIVKLEHGFPFYGGFVFADGRRYPDDAMAMPASDSVWVYPELLTQLELTADDHLSLGGAQFKIAGVVVEDSYKSIRVSDYVPRIYMTAAAIERAGLIQYGATARYSVFYKFRDNFDNERLEVIENELEAVVGESFHARSPNDGSDRVARMLQILADFLSLLALVALYLSLVGVFYLYSGFLLAAKSDMTILIELGMRRGRLIAAYLLHFLLLTTVAGALVLALVWALGPTMQQVIASQVGGAAKLQSDPYFYLRAAAVVGLASPLIAWPMLSQALLGQTGLSWRSLPAYVPLLTMLAGLSIYIAGEGRLGLYFCLAVLVCLLLGLALGAILLRALTRPGFGLNIASALAVKSATRKRPFTLTLGVALFFAVGLFALLPQIGYSLAKVLSVAEQQKPRLFLIDIQERQIEGLQKAAADFGSELQNLSPFIGARVIAHNGVAFDDQAYDAEQPENDLHRELRNRSVNLSYRGDFYDSEALIAGRPFSGRYSGDDPTRQVAELSIEERYAKRTGLSLGDRLTFDVLGLAVDAEVINLRSVRWTDFVPNFFYLLQDGVLNDAPKTYLATLPPGNYSADAVIMRLAADFANVTVVDVKYVIDNIVTMVASLTAVLKRAGILAIAVGLLLIAIIIRQQLWLRCDDILRLKMIGVKLAQIRRAFLLEFAAIAVAATTAGLLLSLAGAFGVNRFLFQEPWRPYWSFIAATAVAAPLLVTAIVAVVSHSLTRQKEATPFSEELS